ncbi:hypothetical protein JAB8_37920 [Janthinobacterium sp. HH106]|uniref:hypothetical protein n=1 Tax=Janthinobacterium sp. HH106 TaxID=1537278 RepID=UPI00089304C2|nr:hypothetical protein [Janthinobacterium sp. HH106]OEZ85610.1 hypothetical protein JAB8_37920 [Janthinobacterium sp. HH106]
MEIQHTTKTGKQPREQNMTDVDLIERLADAVAQRMAPSIPLAVDLWDIATIAAYLKREPGTVREQMACLPSFPKAIRLPTSKGRAQPLYNAKEVIAWVQSYREKN